MVAKDIRVALSCGSSEGTDDISRITKHDPGMLFALRDGQVQGLILIMLHYFCKPLADLHICHCNTHALGINFNRHDIICITQLITPDCSTMTLQNLSISEVHHWHDVQGKVTFPSSAPGTKYEMALNGGNMVLWASQSRLCLAALFLQAARDAASTLTAAGGTAVVPHKVGHQE